MTEIPSFNLDLKLAPQMQLQEAVEGDFDLSAIDELEESQDFDPLNATTSTSDYQ
jgi:hypothetical protein